MRRLHSLINFCRDDRGSADIFALILATAVVGIGGMVGLVQIRDQVSQELGDIAVALDNVDQSFSYTINVDSNGDGTADFTTSASYSDNAATLVDAINQAPACLLLNVVPTTEGGALVSPSGVFP